MRNSIHLWAVGTVILSGCTTSRESIIASVNNVIGITVAQNQQTQMYEAKAGYVRTQFYMIPTGKVVENAADRPLHEIHNDADKAPQVVSAINTESGVNQLIIGIKSKELFAVGSDAVKSPAAIAMFLANAESKEHSAQAATALTGFASAGERTSLLPRHTPTPAATSP